MRIRHLSLVEILAACSLCLCRIEVHAFTPKVPPNLPVKTKESTKRNFIEEAQKTVTGAFTSRRLKDYQKKSVPIALSFVPEKYDAHPLFRNRHLQTILGVFVRQSPGCAYIEKSNIIGEVVPVVNAVVSAVPKILGIGEGDAACDYWDERESFDTPDGDFFDVDFKFQNPEIGGGGKATVIIIHGLESNSNSSLSTNMARSYVDRGMDVACVNFRGCSGRPNKTCFQYHAGFTDDLITFLDRWTEKGDRRPIYISGFSLGANVAMKLLGDLGMEAVDKYNIRGAAVSGAPFDLNWHWRQLIDDKFNKIVYAGSMIKSMKKKVEYITDTYFDGDKETVRLDYWKAMNATTIPEIEDAMVAPLYGFEDKFDYYDRSASLPVVDFIAVPTYVVNAADDPFFEPEFFPFEKDCSCNEDGAPLKIERTPHGGHLGHLFHRVDKGGGSKVASFVPMELARFIDHVHNST